ncbi:TniQ family protein [Mycolicibacterium frederiksbergense]
MIAARHKTSYPLLLNRLVPLSSHNTIRDRFLHLDEIAPPRCISAIAAALTINEDQVAAMTLAGLNLPPLLPDNESRYVYTPWGRPLLYRRFCPACLDHDDGRWSLRWRLPWVTVCIEHAALLYDTCPQCGRKQYRAPGCFGDRQPPRPAFCLCGTDLRNAALLALPTTAMIDAQRTINKLAACDRVDSGIYTVTTVSSAQVLTDIRHIALHVLCTSTPASLSTLAGKKDGAAMRRWLQRLSHREADRPTAHLQFSAHGSAAVVTAGVMAALHVIEQPSLQDAANALTALAPDSDGYKLLYAPLTFRGFGPSAPLSGVEVLNQSSTWGNLEKLRFRVYGPLPRRPETPSAVLPILPSIPTMMWTAWAAALDVFDRSMEWPTYRQTLSWLLPV